MSDNSGDRPNRGTRHLSGDCMVLSAEKSTEVLDAIADLRTAGSLIERCAYNLAGTESVATVSELIRIAADVQLLTEKISGGKRH